MLLFPSLSSAGKSFTSESSALNSDQLSWQFSQCVTRRNLFRQWAHDIAIHLVDGLIDLY
jgi:hypothetical protein